MNFLHSFFSQFESIASLYAIRIVIALVVLLIGYFIIKLSTGFIFRMMEKLKVDSTLESFLKSTSALLTYIVLFMIVLTIAGVPSTYFAGILVGLGTAIGFGLKDELKTVANGIIILVAKPFKVGDEISISIDFTGKEYCGKVIDIQLFQTIIKTYDDLRVVLNNANIISTGIVKLSDNRTSRQEIIITTPLTEDIVKVKRVLSKILEVEPLVLQIPKPLVAMSSYEESSINFIMRFWTKQGDHEKATFSVNESVKISFDKENISSACSKKDIKS